MEDLNSTYVTRLKDIKNKIQESEELRDYLEEEEEEQYKALVQKFEGEINELYNEVADKHPLQLIAFEQSLLDDGFEGLYLPRILGYSVLRGRINEKVKYYRPQSHFKNILDTIINSSNFEQIKQRIGQSIQIGFALSSDIWITNIIDSIENKKVKSFLQSQKILEFRDETLRNSALVKFRKQFQSLNFQTAEFPESSDKLMVEARMLKDFLIYRAHGDFDNSSIEPAIEKMITNEKLFGEKEFFEICLLVGMYYDPGKKLNKKLTSTLSTIRKEREESVTDEFFRFIIEHDERVGGITAETEKNISDNIDRAIKDGISEYFEVLDKVNSKGYIHKDAITAVREYYYKNEGLSIENDAIRHSVLAKLRQFLNNLEVTDYSEYFEINKTFTAYMDVFSNQKFNQELKHLSLAFIKRCLKNFKDKRSKEYQEIKKFVKITFVDYGFMTEKQVAEIFKTRRKPRVK